MGAYGRGKVFDFNGKLRPAEFLLREDGSFQQIRRAETPEDYFRTIFEWTVREKKLKRIQKNTTNNENVKENLKLRNK